MAILPSHLAYLTPLIVDDNEDVLISLRSMLAHAGFSGPITTCDAPSALAILQSPPHTIHFVISDLDMPSMNGISFCTQVRRFYPQIPFILMTAASCFDTMLLAKDAGVDAFLSKPFLPTDICHIVTRIFDSRSAAV